MKSTLLACALAAALAPSADAQVSLHINIGLPPAPPLVVVEPGIQVVAGFGEEVFLYGGWYWCRRPNGWYRARTPQARFNWIESRRVPSTLVKLPPGHYKNWHHDGRKGPAERREHGSEKHGRGHGRQR